MQILVVADDPIPPLMRDFVHGRESQIVAAGLVVKRADVHEAGKLDPGCLIAQPGLHQIHLGVWVRPKLLRKDLE